MTYKPPYETIESYRRRQRYGPLIMSILALLLVIIGIFLLWTWASGGSIAALGFLSSPTPTATETPTPSETPPPSATVAETFTPTLETTATAAAPFSYVVEEGDTLVGLAEKFGLDPNVGFLIIMDYNNWEQGRFLVLGETIIIPHPDAQLFTPSPIPALVAGSEILYRVLPGDTVASIAEQFLSTVDAIIAANEIGDPNNIGVGDILFVPIRLITATFGPPPSATITPGGPTFTPTATPTASATQ